MNSEIQLKEEKRRKSLMYEQQLDQSERVHAQIFADASRKNMKLLHDFVDVLYNIP